MKTVYLFFLSIVLYTNTSAQKIIDFESSGLPSDTFDNGANGEGGFVFDPVFFPNTYDAAFDTWNGWAVSSKTDSVSPGFVNQYSSISGGGAEDSRIYMVTYAPAGSFIQLGSRSKMSGLYVNNSTYAYLSMKDGDAFAKRFGGADGSDPDYFKIAFYGFLNGTKLSDSVEFYLADFRFENGEEDYIVRDWSYVDLSIFGVVDSIECVLRSSDVGAFGINTPTYFCLDNVILEDGTTATKSVNSKSEIAIFPNPTTSRLILSDAYLDWDEVIISNAWGIRLGTISLSPGQVIEMGHLSPGIYWLAFFGGGKGLTKMIIKQ